MLTTRCPDCQTTFRITSVALHAVAGEVRCGQCRAVFNAFDSLTDTRRTPGSDAEPKLQPEPQEVFGIDAYAAAGEHGTADPNADVLRQPGEPLPAEPLPADTAEPPTTQTDTTAEEPTEAPADRQSAAQQPETQTQMLLQPPITAAPAEPSEPAAVGAPWRPSERRESESGVWRVAASLAALALALQASHHFRESLAGVPFFGVQLERVYALAGRPIEHNGSPVDFSIVDWTATAQQPDPTQPGRLEITAGVRNDSDSPLRYPMLLLELTDRWEAVVGARVFAPEEYMGTRISQNAHIGPATTVTAHLNLVDPGPAAYGFEVDVCVPASTGRMHCKSDLVFE